MKPDETPKLTHVDSGGRAHMVNVGDKVPSRRMAIAEGWIRMEPTTLALIRQNEVKKGDVLTTAQIGGITAGK